MALYDANGNPTLTTGAIGPSNPTWNTTPVVEQGPAVYTQEQAGYYQPGVNYGPANPNGLTPASNPTPTTTTTTTNNTSSGLDPHINPATGQWDDNYYATHAGASGTPQIDTAAINAVYEPTMNYLNQAESQIRSDYPSVLDAAQKQYETAYAELNANKTKNLGTIASNEQTVGQQKEDALTSARRLYDELRRGYQQRFGGSTSAGQAASELSAVEQQRQMGQTTRDYGTAIRQISQQKLQLDQDYQVGQAKLQEQKQLALQQAQTNFTQQLMQIQAQRAQTESQKAAAKLDALNQLKNQAYAIQQQAVTYQQNLDMFYKQQQADLQTYAAKLQMAGQGVDSITSQYLKNTTTNPTSNLQVASSNGANTTNYTGVTTPKKEDLLAGYAGSTLNPSNLLSKIGINYSSN